MAGGTGDGFFPIFGPQLPIFPDLNINGLVFFASLKVAVKRICTHCISREEMASVIKTFDEYPREDCWSSDMLVQ